MKNSSKPVFNNVTPAYLFITHESQAQEVTTDFLQSIFCIHDNCKSCIICIQISTKTYVQSLWITPEKRYVLDDLDPIFHQITFMLESHETFFFIIEHADLLSTFCANKLLKIVEEPPAGYHFIFIAHQAQQVLPTIQSRCITYTFDGQIKALHQHALFSYFTHKSDPLLFLKEIATLDLSETESMNLLNALFSYWVEQYKKSLLTKNDTEIIYAKKMVLFIKKNMQNPIMPGSSKLFWKNLFITKDGLK